MTGAAALVWALAQDLGLDGFRPPQGVLAAEYATACRGGLALACEVSTGAVPRGPKGPLDVPALAGRAAEWCAQRDDVACLVEAMLRVRDPFTGYGTDTTPEDQRAARTAFVEACDRGLARGCTELGMTYLRETWSYRSEVLAEVSFRRACDAGEPEGCRQLGLALGPKNAAERRTWLEKAASLGNVEAAADLARLADDPSALADACVRGSSAACRAAGTPAKACASGDPDACLTGMLESAAAAATPPAELTETLTSLCATLDRACREAEFLRDGSPIVSSEPGLYASPGLVERYLVDLKGQLRLCHVRALKVNPEAHGVLDLWMRIAADGRVVGVHVPNPFDPGLADCTDRALRTLKLKPPLLGPMLSHVLLPFEATTRVDLEQLDNDPEGGSLTLLADEVQARGDALDACIVANDDPRFIREGAFRATVDRTGNLQNFEWVSADFEDETRQCLEAALRAPYRAAPLIPKRFEATLRFLEEFQVPTWKIVIEPLPPVTPDHFRLLALVPAQAEIEGVTVPTLPDAVQRVERIHARAAELVAGFTRGGLVLDTTVRAVPASIAGATLDVEDEELTRLRFEAFDVPDDVWSRLPVGEYDGIVLWLPTPPGKVAEVGTTTNGTLRGASFSALPMPSDRDRSPRVETLLHGLWTQYAVRAEGQLAVELPSADQRLVAEGQTFDNEFWTLDPYRTAPVSGTALGDRQTGDAMPFYQYLFRKVLHPAMRADLARFDRVEVVEPDDLALLASPMREGGARNVEVLTDGRRSLDPPAGKPVFQDGAWLSPDRPADDAGFWGVSWASPVEVRRIRMRVGDGPEGAPTVRTVAIEGRVGEQWVGLSTLTLTRADVVLTLPATRALDAIRVRVLERLPDVTPTCQELEVYASAK